MYGERACSRGAVKLSGAVVGAGSMVSGCGDVGCVEVPGGHFDVAGEHGVEQLVEASSDVPVQPALPAGGALLNGHVEHERDLAVALGQLGSSDRPAVSLVASFAAHQHLLR